MLPLFDTVRVGFSENHPTRSWMGTSAFAHIDFTRDQIDEFLGRTFRSMGISRDISGRIAMIQTWRPITPAPQDHPFALCDGRTVAPEDIIAAEVHGPAGERFRAVAAHYNPAHRWSFFPDMDEEEVIIWKGYDSQGDPLNVLHSSFWDTTVENPVPRGSVECRFVAFF